jgi:hypothetical protein
MADQTAASPEITIDENGGLHFDGSTEELHSYIDKLNESVYWMQAYWEEYLNREELIHVSEIREWWKDDSGGISELSPEGWPTYSFPEPGTEAFVRMMEIAQFHRIAQDRMIEEAEIRDREEAKAGTNPPTPAT